MTEAEGNDEDETPERILMQVLDEAVKAFNREVADYDLYIAYDFKVKLYPKFSEDDKENKPMFEFAANNEGNFK